MASNRGSDLYNYVADSGEVHVIRLGDITLTLLLNSTLQNQPTDAPTSPFWAQVSRGATEYGLLPRKVSVCITEPTTNSRLDEGATYDVVVLDPAEYNAATINKVVEYGGFAAKVVGKSGENIYPGI